MGKSKGIAVFRIIGYILHSLTGLVLSRRMYLIDLIVIDLQVLSATENHTAVLCKVLTYNHAGTGIGREHGANGKSCCKSTAA